MRIGERGAGTTAISAARPEGEAAILHIADPSEAAAR